MVNPKVSKNNVNKAIRFIFFIIERAKKTKGVRFKLYAPMQ